MAKKEKKRTPNLYTHARESFTYKDVKVRKQVAAEQTTKREVDRIQNQLENTRKQLTTLRTYKPAVNYNAGAPWPAWKRKFDAAIILEKELYIKLYTLRKKLRK